MSEIEKQEAKGRKRNVQINIRISEAEAEQLRKKVEQSGMSQQEYILSCVLNKPITNTDGIKELIPELKRVGNNLNQIAHALNGGRYYQYNLITDNQKELEHSKRQKHLFAHCVSLSVICRFRHLYLLSWYG